MHRDDALDGLHRPPFDCDCGRGNRVALANGVSSCTHTLQIFRMGHGSIPAQWLPLHATSRRSAAEAQKPNVQAESGTARVEAASTTPSMGCACRWIGDEYVERCDFHDAWHTALHEWAERARTAEALLRELRSCKHHDPYAKKSWTNSQGRWVTANVPADLWGRIEAVAPTGADNAALQPTLAADANDEDPHVMSALNSGVGREPTADTAAAMVEARQIAQMLSCPRCHANWAFYPAEGFMSVRSNEWCGWCERAGPNELLASTGADTGRHGSDEHESAAHLPVRLLTGKEQ